jgi:hypothetical protein
MEFESDPAAEFLNREREQLADIINENDSEFLFELLLIKILHIF